jgi:ornithine cyclodeaminase
MEDRRRQPAGRQPLARKDSRRILLVGAGAVARSMVEAYRSLWPDAEFTVWSRKLVTAANMADAAGPADDHRPGAAVPQADIICTCTMSTEPLIRATGCAPASTWT